MIDAASGNSMATICRTNAAAPSASHNKVTSLSTWCLVGDVYSSFTDCDHPISACSIFIF